MKTKRKPAKAKKSSDIDDFNSMSDFDKTTMYLASRQAHAVLQAGIKKALRLEEWPNFYKMYGRDESQAGAIARYLVEKVDELRRENEELRESNEELWVASM